MAVFGGTTRGPSRGRGRCAFHRGAICRAIHGGPPAFIPGFSRRLSQTPASARGGPAPAPLPSQRVRPRNRGRGSVRSSRHGDVYALCRPFRAGTWFGRVFPGLRPGLYYGAPLGLIPSCGAVLTGRSKVALPARPEGNAQGIPTVTTIGALSERHHPVPREYGRPPLSPLQRDFSIKTVIRTPPPKCSHTQVNRRYIPEGRPRSFKDLSRPCPSRQTGD